jgi:hypothetical protein
MLPVRRLTLLRAIKFWTAQVVAGSGLATSKITQVSTGTIGIFKYILEMVFHLYLLRHHSLQPNQDQLHEPS